MIRIYDTAQQAVVPLELRDEGKVTIYACGPTVYGPPHIGHGRMTLVFDIVRRYLQWSGLDVTYVSNVTDIDDNIIDRANNEGREWTDIAVKCEKVWFEAMDRLEVLRPDEIPHATDYVEQMVAMIAELIERDRAYVTADGVYLHVADIEGYGLLAHQSLDQLLEGGGDREIVGTEKRNPADFALWKFAKPDEPSWPSPWGDGRPGWHTECVVMSLDLLGDGFDLHTGGMDLTFPHHENERAQAVALGREFSRHWMHNGFIESDGEKMSKSLGNVRNLLDLTEQYDPRAYRLLVLQSHYRSPLEISDKSLEAAVAALQRLDAFARRTAELDGAPTPEAIEEFRTLMSNDFNTAGSVDLMFRLVRDANTALDADDYDSATSASAAVREIAGALGLRIEAAAATVPPEVQALAEDREAARAAKDFSLADEIRDELAAKGWVIEDSAAGPQVRRA